MKKQRLIAICLFILGISIYLFPLLAQKYYHYMQQEEVHWQFEKVETLPMTERKQRKQQADACNDSIFSSEAGVNDPFTNNYDQKAHKACQEPIEKKQLISSLEIPKLNEIIPIYLGASEDNLAKGVGQVEGSSLPVGGVNSHSVLAGHRGMWTKSMFRNLDELMIGDTFYVHTLDEKLAYEVYDVKVILPHETETLHVQKERDLVSLITCHPYGDNTHRLVVYGERK